MPRPFLAVGSAPADLRADGEKQRDTSLISFKVGPDFVTFETFGIYFGCYET